MDERDKLLLKRFREKLPAGILKRVSSVIVFGSRARGNTQPDSDLDLAVLVDRKTPEFEQALEDAAYQAMWDFDFQPVISLKVFQKAKFDLAVKKSFSFYRHVVTQGVSV